jgi:hypothetical protein
MILCIEFWKGDILLSGKAISLHELENQIRYIQSIYDRSEDNIVALLCRIYHWQIISVTSDVTPEVIYDRDTGLIPPVH